MSEITRVGVDLEKHVLQVHAVDASVKLVINRYLIYVGSPCIRVRTLML